MIAVKTKDAESAQAALAEAQRLLSQKAASSQVGGPVRPINTGIAHQAPGVGQVGAGLLRAPIECFVQAFEAMRETWNVKRQRRDCVDA